MSDYIGIMPFQFNSNLGNSPDELISRDKLDVTIQIEVDAAVAQSLLPTWKSSDGKTCGYRPWAPGPTGKPLLFINYTQERDVDYMAGGGYNEVEFYLSAEFVGENSWTHDGKEYDGAYGMFAILLMPSNLIPLLAGRELMGTPKHMADVTDLVLKENDDEDKIFGTFEIRNLHGSAFLAGNLRNIAPAGYAILNEPMPEHDGFLAIDGWQDADNVEPGFKVMCWKHIPAADWAHSPPDLSYSIAVSLDGTIKELSEPMVGDGEIVFPNDLDAQTHPNISAAIGALKDLLENHGNTFSGNVLIRHYSNAYRSQDIHRMDGPRLPRD